MSTGQFDAIDLQQGWPANLQGSLDLDGLVAPPPRNAPVGSFHAVFPAAQPKPSLSVPQDPVEPDGAGRATRTARSRSTRSSR